LGGKTGTTNDSVDAWFAGYTPSLWAWPGWGFDQPTSLGSRETGGGAALPIWLGYMEKALERFPEQKRQPPPSGLMVDGQAMFFAEYPPDQAISGVGLQEKKESIEDLLDSLPGMGDQSSTALPASN